MADKRSLALRILGLPAALWRRVQHQWALRRARRASLARVATRPPRRLLVMCYGNIYRSPFVAARLRARLAGQADFEIRSAGFHPVPGRPSPLEYVQMVHQLNTDLSPHRSRVVAPADLEWAEGVIIMDRYNWERLRPFGAEIQGKILWLGAFASAGPLEIEDPYAQPAHRVQAIVEQMSVAAEGLAKALAAPEKHG
jgi:protein-tyrosine phosphatase